MLFCSLFGKFLIFVAVASIIVNVAYSDVRSRDSFLLVIRSCLMSQTLLVTRTIMIMIICFITYAHYPQ